MSPSSCDVTADSCIINSLLTKELPEDSSMQIAGLGTRGSGTCGTGTAVLGQFFCDSLHEKDVSVKM